MTNPLRELLREARLHVERDAEQWPNDGGPEMLERIDAALAQPEPRVSLEEWRTIAEIQGELIRSIKDFPTTAQQPEPVAPSERPRIALLEQEWKIVQEWAQSYAAAMIARYVAAIDQADGRIAEKDAEIAELKREIREEYVSAIEADEYRERVEAAEHALAQIKEAKAVARIDLAHPGCIDWLKYPMTTDGGLADWAAGKMLYAAAPQSPAASNQENAGRKTRQPEETRGLLGASELSGDGHQIDDPQQVGPQPPAELALVNEFERGVRAAANVAGDGTITSELILKKLLPAPQPPAGNRDAVVVSPLDVWLDLSNGHRKLLLR
jgi:hypothetical protein